MSNTPVSTQWLLDATIDVSQHEAIHSVFMIYSQKTNMKGTCFALANRYIITNEHVVRGCEAKHIKARSAIDETWEVSSIIVDAARDLQSSYQNDH